jgi:hypothetical protein
VVKVGSGNVLLLVVLLQHTHTHHTHTTHTHTQTHTHTHTHTFTLSSLFHPSPSLLRSHFFPRIRLGAETTFTQLGQRSTIRLTVRNLDKFTDATLQISSASADTVRSHLSAFEVPSQVTQLSSTAPTNRATIKPPSSVQSPVATLSLRAADGSSGSVGELFVDVRPLSVDGLSQVASTLFAVRCQLDGGPADAHISCEYTMFVRLACVAQIALPDGE